MKRIALTDDSGRWFDKDKAEFFDEGWDRKTDHEGLYRTHFGKWVLNSWSQYPGTTETWELVSDEFAAKWLITNERDCDSDIVANYIAKLEI